MQPGDRDFTNQQKEARQVNEQDILFVDNYGGLNTNSPSVNCPYADTPEMVNFDINVTGILSKRLGTFVREEFTTDPRGFMLTTYSLNNGLTLLVMKLGTSLAVYVAPGLTKDNLKRAIEVETFTNVFTSASASQRPSFVWVEGVYGFGNSLIMCTASTNPIILTIFETDAQGDGNTDFTLTGDYRPLFDTTNASNFIYFDGDDVTVEPMTSISYSAPNTTFTFGNSIASGQSGVMFSCNWSWACEALKRTREQCHASFFRFNTSVTADANVEVPDGIQDGLQSDTDVWVNLGNTLAYNNFLCTVEAAHDNTGGGFTLANPPTSATEFGWSILEYVDGSDFVQPGVSHITFGGIAGAGTNPPTPVYFTRQFLLPFNNLQPVEAQDVGARDSRGAAWTQRANATRVNGSASVRNYWLYTPALAVDTTGGSTLVQAISFQANSPRGIATDYIEVFHTDTGGVGSSGVANYADYNEQGYFTPWYGGHAMMRQFEKEYPTLVATYQNRLVIAGIPRQPMTILFSGTGQVSSRFRFQNFESAVFSDVTLATEPLSVTLDGRSDDSITGMIAWYDSLFVFTERSVRRITGGQTISISNTNISQTVIAEVGCKSKHGFVATDDSILFVSDSGLYQIRTTDTSGGYDAVNVGIKIEQVFIQHSENLPDVSWMYYNQVRDTVFIGLSSPQDAYLCSRLIVYYNRRLAFGEYTLLNGYFYSAFGASDSERDFLCYARRDTEITDAPGASAEVLILEQNIDNLNTDLTYSPSAAQLIAGTTTDVFRPYIAHTIDDGQRIVSLLPAEQSSNTFQGFRTLPLNNFYSYLDVDYDNGVYETDLVGGTDYYRYPFQQSIFVNTVPYTTGDTIEIELLDDFGNPPIILIEDTLMIDHANLTIGSTNGLFTVTYDDANSDSIYYLGSSIPCWHFTPTLLANVPIQFKRGIHYLGYYDNRGMHDLYRASDANSTASQQSEAVADRHKTEAGISVGILYNDARSGVYELELYGTEDLTWDVSLFDLPSTSYRNQLNDVVRLVEPIIGVGYSIQVCNFSFGIERAALIGYKVESRLKGRNTTRWY